MYCNLEQTADLIHELGGIVSIHAGRKSNSIENIRDSLPCEETQKTDIATHVDIFELGKEADVAGYKEKVIPSIARTIGKTHPMIICSDAHCPSDIGRQWTWIKADPTFEGLKQILYEPEERVYIGEMNPNKPRSSYSVIDSIKFSPYGEMKGQQIFFNAGLNTIIGGRSSGKSILLGCIARKIDKNIVPKNNNEEYTKLVDGFIKNNDNYLTWSGSDGAFGALKYYSQSAISDMVRRGDDINAFVEEIVIKRPGVLGEKRDLNKSVSDNTAAINNMASELYQQKLRMQEADNAIHAIGSISVIEAEISRLNEAIMTLKSVMAGSPSPDEEKEYQALSKKRQQLMAKQVEAESDILLLKAIRSATLFAAIDRDTAGLSRDVHNTITEFFGKLKEKTAKEWETFVDDQIESLMDSSVKIAKELSGIDGSAVYKKVESFQSKNAELMNLINARDAQMKKKADIDKLFTERDAIARSSSRLQVEIFNNFKEYCKAYKKYSTFVTASGDQDDSKMKVSAAVGVDCNSFNAKWKEICNTHTGAGHSLTDVVTSDIEEFIRGCEVVFNAVCDSKMAFKGGNTMQQAVSQIFAASYFRIDYDVTYENDKLKDMSEGKKAFVVLKLLLDFDKSDCPILIDQPEDDLDNRAI